MQSIYLALVVFLQVQLLLISYIIVKNHSPSFPLPCNAQNQKMIQVWLQSIFYMMELVQYVSCLLQIIAKSLYLNFMLMTALYMNLASPWILNDATATNQCDVCYQMTTQIMEYVYMQVQIIKFYIYAILSLQNYHLYEAMAFLWNYSLLVHIFVINPIIFLTLNYFLLLEIEYLCPLLEHYWLNYNFLYYYWSHSNFIIQKSFIYLNYQISFIIQL